jgi:hypothetical protein
MQLRCRLSPVRQVRFLPQAHQPGIEIWLASRLAATSTFGVLRSRLWVAMRGLAGFFDLRFDLRDGPLSRTISAVRTALGASAVVGEAGEVSFSETRRGSTVCADPRRHPAEKNGQC